MLWQITLAAPGLHIQRTPPVIAVTAAVMHQALQCALARAHLKLRQHVESTLVEGGALCTEYSAGQLAAPRLQLCIQ